MSEPSGSRRPAGQAGGEPSVAIVTGASGGIGGGVVAGFRGIGYSVVATGLHVDASDDDGVLTVPGDLTDQGDARRVVEEGLDRFGRIDSLVNCAGIYVGKPFTDYTIDDYRAITAVNLMGFFSVTQPVIAHMLTRGSGHIVHITTSLVDHADNTRPSALTALTKGGLAAVTRSLAIEYASHGIRVNAVSPGVIKTPLHDAASYAGMAALHPLGRVGEVGDVVDAILYLERASFVTGEILHVDGGQAAGQ